MSLLMLALDWKLKEPKIHNRLVCVQVKQTRYDVLMSDLKSCRRSIFDLYQPDTAVSLLTVSKKVNFPKCGTL